MKQKKAEHNFLILIPVIIVLIVTIIFFMNKRMTSNQNGNKELPNQSPVVISGKTQIINILANSGYSPESISAKANLSTILKITSNNAYGCERAFTIPSLDIERTLPVNGEETFDIGTFKPGETLFASCSMGMYTFTVNFE